MIIATVKILVYVNIKQRINFEEQKFLNILDKLFAEKLVKSKRRSQENDRFNTSNPRKDK